MSIILILFLCLIVVGKTMQNLLNKSISSNSSIIETSIFIRLIPVFLVLPILYLNGSFQFIGYDLLFLSIFVGFLLGLGTLVLTQAYNLGEVSIITPFYSFNPIFGGIFSWIILSQKLNKIGIIGILLITIGGYIIKINKFNSFTEPIRKIYQDKGVLYLVLYTFIIGLISPFDSIGVNSINPGLWLFYTYLFASLVIISFYIYKNGLNFSSNSYNYENYIMFIGIGFFTFISVFSLFYAYQFLEVAYVLSIFMLNIVLTSLIGVIIYDEKLYLNKIIAIVMMTLGAIIIILV